MDAPKPGFFAIAAAEARQTWGGRWLVLAGALVVLAFGIVLLAPWDPFG